MLQNLFKQLLIKAIQVNTTQDSIKNSVNQRIDSTKSTLKTATNNVKQFILKIIKTALFSIFIGTPAIFFWGLFASSYLNDNSTSFFDRVLFQNNADPLVEIHTVLSDELHEPIPTIKQPKVEPVITPIDSTVALPGEMEEVKKEESPEISDEALLVDLAPAIDDKEFRGETDEVQKSTPTLKPEVTEIKTAVETTKADVLAFVQNNIDSRGIKASSSTITRNGRLAWAFTSILVFMALFFAYLLKLKSSWGARQTQQSSYAGARSKNDKPFEQGDASRTV